MNFFSLPSYPPYFFRTVTGNKQLIFLGLTSNYTFVGFSQYFYISIIVSVYFHFTCFKHFHQFPVGKTGA